jgi:signal transduction histidine kinase
MLNSIQSRTLAALLVAVLTTAAVSEWLSYRSAKQMLVNESARMLRITADAKKEELLLNFRRQQDRALAFLENNLLDCIEVRDIRCVRVNLNNFAKAEEAIGAMVITHGGKKIAVGNTTGLSPLKDATHVQFENAERTYIVVAHSEVARSDIALRFPASLIVPLFRNSQYSPGDYSNIFLIDSTGDIFAGSDRSGARKPPGFEAAALMACVSGHDGDTRGKNAAGATLVMSYSNLGDNNGGCVLAQIDEEQMLLPASRLRYEMLGIAIILMIVATAAAFILAQRVARPIRQLTQRVRRLQRGDFDSTIPIHGPAEIRTFAETFAAMVESLRRSREVERKAQEKLMQTEKLAAAGRLAATVAHEVNNPLSAAMNSLFLLRDKVSGTGSALLETAEEQLRRVAGITRQTLGFYRENASKINFDLEQAVVELIDTFIPRARNKDLELVAEVSPMMVHAVKGEIQQVIANLLNNAIDASPARTKIRVRARRIRSSVFGDVVQISVGDSGPGIPVALRARIWEPFFTTKEGVGTGLGLFVCKQIVERHKGVIRAHSTHQGTVFTVILPQSADQAKQAAG